MLVSTCKTNKKWLVTKKAQLTKRERAFDTRFLCFWCWCNNILFITGLFLKSLSTWQSFIRKLLYLSNSIDIYINFCYNVYNMGIQAPFRDIDCAYGRISLLLKWLYYILMICEMNLSGTNSNDLCTMYKPITNVKFFWFFLFLMHIINGIYICFVYNLNSIQSAAGIQSKCIFYQKISLLIYE